MSSSLLSSPLSSPISSPFIPSFPLNIIPFSAFFSSSPFSPLSSLCLPSHLLSSPFSSCSLSFDSTPPLLCLSSSISTCLKLNLSWPSTPPPPPLPPSGPCFSEGNTLHTLSSVSRLGFAVVCKFCLVIFFTILSPLSFFLYFLVLLFRPTSL